jgi:hypothetical protein
MSDSHPPHDPTEHGRPEHPSDEVAKPPPEPKREYGLKHRGAEEPVQVPERAERDQPVQRERTVPSLSHLVEAHHDAGGAGEAHPLSEAPGNSVFAIAADPGAASHFSGDHEALLAEHPLDRYPTGSGLDRGVHGELTTVAAAPPSGTPLPPLGAQVHGGDAGGPADDHAAEPVAAMLWRAFGEGQAPSSTDGRIDPVASLERLSSSISDPFTRDVIETALADARASS